MKFTKVALACVLGMTSLVGTAHSTFAEVTSSGNSKSSVTFIAGSGPVTPVDPTNPIEPLIPSGPTDPTDPPTGNAGALTLDYVSSVEFGANEISNKTEIYSAKSKKPFIQVTDRRGTWEGWSVVAKASKFTNGTVDTLPGAIITFKNGSVISLSTGGSPVVNQTISLNTDGSTVSTVVSATSGAGFGTWVTRWLGPNPEVNDGSLNDNVTLTVPAGSATIGNHEATITWTLTDAPGL